jgi:hypothetical protein
MGVKISTTEGMIFEEIGNYARRKVDEGHKIWEALIVCEWCLPSVYSIFGHVFAIGLGILPFEWSWQLLIRWPLVVMGASISSGLIWTIYLMFNQIKENNMAQTDFYKNINHEKE